MYITVYSLGGSPGGIYGNRIARQQPILPSFPFLSCAVEQQQQQQRQPINQSKAEEERVVLESSEDIQKALHAPSVHTSCLNMRKKDKNKLKSIPFCGGRDRIWIENFESMLK